MRMSNLFFQTLREAPAEAEIISHQLMLRSSMIAPIAAGIFDILPLAQRVKHKMEAIMRDEMDGIGGQEVTLPMVHPAELWQRSGRWYQIGDDMARLQDRNDRDYCLGMTHEEIMADMVSRVVNSYRQLPFILYQIQTKFRDEPRPRAGAIRMREFTMKDAYTFDRDMAGLDAVYPKFYQAYFNIFRRYGLDVVAVESDTGMMGGTMAHEFMSLTPVGEDTLLICDSCDYSANRQIATFRKPTPTADAAAPLEEVHTPNIMTIAGLADFLSIGLDQTAKAVFMVAEIEESEQKSYEKFVFVVVRGDMEVNETKLSNAIKAKNMRPATTEEIRSIGAEPGYGSPLGIDRSRVLLVVDDLVTTSPNLVAGANRVDTHLRNVTYGRDFTADVVTDVVAAGDGHPCPTCGSPLRTVRGVEVGNIFKLGTKYSVAMGATYLDEHGTSQPVVMGSYGIGTERVMACIVEAHHDDNGIQWPITIAPYQVMLVGLGNAKSPDVIEATDGIYNALKTAGVETLYDDRDERAGVKFNDADLLGMPLRLTVGSKGLKNGQLELKLRRNGEMHEIPVDNVVGSIKALIDAEVAAIHATLQPEILA